MTCEVISIEIQNRIRLSVAAYAYEFGSNPIVTDSEFDSLAESIDTSVLTGNSELDMFFQNHFNKDTGIWIHKHPDLPKLKELYNDYYK